MALAVLVAGLFFVTPAAADESVGQPTILAELFTSQGCSSCPPADRLLSRLAADDRVIALAFHVDYWNYIGWTDPFSSAAWSERQRTYAAVFGAGRIYTPQLVINGRWEGVGSDAREVDDLLGRAAGAPQAELRLEVEQDAGTLIALVRARMAAGCGERRLQAWLAVTESGFATPVGHGENGGHTLRNDHVVRRLEPLGSPLAVSAAADAEARAAVPLDPTWDRRRLQLVAFLADPSTRHILGATRTHLTAR